MTSISRRGNAILCMDPGTVAITEVITEKLTSAFNTYISGLEEQELLDHSILLEARPRLCISEVIVRLVSQIWAQEWSRGPGGGAALSADNWIINVYEIQRGSTGFGSVRLGVSAVDTTAGGPNLPHITVVLGSYWRTHRDEKIGVSTCDSKGRTVIF